MTVFLLNQYLDENVENNFIINDATTQSTNIVKIIINSTLMLLAKGRTFLENNSKKEGYVVKYQ